MKAKLLGAALLAAALAACGGKASFTIGGTIGGLSNQGLVLQTSGGDTVAVAAGATSFSFPHSISYGTEYTVSIKAQPDHMTCVVGNPTGSAGHTTVINVQISCTQNSYTLGGSVTGLNGETLVLVNGSSSGSITLTKGTTSFTVPGTIPVGTVYGISVLTQPSNPAQHCVVSNGTGVMGDAPVTNVTVSCTNL